jgi:glycosyltransferase involved in cell wall biosynthesis
MRIHRVARRIPPSRGGQEIHVYELSRRQVARGHEVDLWFTDGTEYPPGARMHRESNQFLGHKPASVVLSSALYAWRASRSMRKHPGADLVHVHGDYAEAYFGARAARAHGIPAVMTVHGGLNLHHLALSRIGLRHVDHFIALGTRVRDDLLRSGAHPDAITVMSSGLDWELIGPYAGRPLPNQPRLVSVGALDPMKNHETVLEAGRLARERFPDLEVVIIGAGAERDRLEALAMGENVTFAGQLSRSEAYEIVSRASIFTIASRRLPSKSEGVPTALLEAMALGRPCVVSTACTPDAIAARDSGTYLTADPDQPKEFADAIVRLLDDRMLAESLGSRAAQAVGGLGWDDIVTRVETVYRAVLGRE